MGSIVEAAVALLLLINALAVKGGSLDQRYNSGDAVELSFYKVRMSQIDEDNKFVASSALFSLCLHSTGPRRLVLMRIHKKPTTIARCHIVPVKTRRHQDITAMSGSPTIFG